MESKTTRRTGRLRVIHLTPRALELCRELAKAHPEGPLLRNSIGGAWTPDSIGSRFYRLRKALGLPAGTCAETIRHGWITDALQAGVPVATVSALAGHVDTAMVSRVYSKLHQRTDHLREEVGKIRPGPKLANPTRSNKAGRRSGGRA
jgi:integrase